MKIIIAMLFVLLQLLILTHEKHIELLALVAVNKINKNHIIPSHSKSSKQVLMAISKLYQFYVDHFSEIFKFIPFDNGSEFASKIWKYNQEQKYI